jgi:hypothetical protein
MEGNPTARATAAAPAGPIMPSSTIGKIGKIGKIGQEPPFKKIGGTRLNDDSGSIG